MENAAAGQGEKRKEQMSERSNNLNQTLASGERVLSLLEETPLVEEIPGDVETFSLRDGRRKKIIE